MRIESVLTFFDENNVFVVLTCGINLIVEAYWAFYGVDGVVRDNISQFDTEQLVKVDWEMVIIFSTIWSKLSPFFKF